MKNFKNAKYLKYLNFKTKQKYINMDEYVL